MRAFWMSTIYGQKNNLRTLVDTLRATWKLPLRTAKGSDGARREQRSLCRQSAPIVFRLYRCGTRSRDGVRTRRSFRFRTAEDTDWFNRAHQANLGLLRVPEVTWLVRRQRQNMASGKSLAELNTLGVFKEQLDRRRQEKT
jgi:hypothetical protein